MTDLALQSLRAAEPHGEAGEALFELARMLLSRKLDSEPERPENLWILENLV